MKTENPCPIKAVVNRNHVRPYRIDAYILRTKDRWNFALVLAQQSQHEEKMPLKLNKLLSFSIGSAPQSFDINKMSNTWNGKNCDEINITHGNLFIRMRKICLLWKSPYLHFEHHRSTIACSLFILLWNLIALNWGKRHSGFFFEFFVCQHPKGKRTHRFTDYKKNT